MPSESDKWGWEHVSVFGGFDRGSGTKRWKCNHCNLRYNGSYSRVRAHLLGFSGVGVKSCPSIDRSLREAFQVLEEERVAQKKKTSSVTGKPGKLIRTSQPTLAWKTITKEDVDDIVARFFYADGLNIDTINSSYFREMVKAIGSFGSGYELPSIDKLSDSFLSKEKGRIEKSVALVRESWPHTGCTILCAGRLDGALGSLNISIFVSSPRGLVFLKAVDVDDTDEGQHVFTSALTDTIMEVGPTNVLQIVSHLGDACKSSESYVLSKFSNIFWSPCTSHSMFMLMEEIAEVEWVFGLRQSLQDMVVSEDWKQWKHNIAEDVVNVESAILDDGFWRKAHSLLQLYEPFVRLLATIDIGKSVLGAAYDWRFQALEALRSQAIDDGILNQLEGLVENRWDVLFSPLHAAGYLLNPRYIGKGQTKDKSVMRGWKATLERYEGESTARRVLREQLSSYWHLEGSLGEEDAVDCRDKMDPVAWWENFGFETPSLQTLAIKVLSQVSSVAMFEEIWQANDFPCREAAGRLGVQKMEDLFFIHNNLRLHGRINGNLCFSFAQRNAFSSSSSGVKTWEGLHLDQSNAMDDPFELFAVMLTSGKSISAWIKSGEENKKRRV
ncbi:hypothetical protein POTOM_035031 [Populus tomentosa]|uniref:DUF659 domain-containing protein n=1 Tax=Populus tomentosa TaxID=118781 RepID=A0A8X8CPL5_POPTO|nr:hypothetical protein POTOM_035031 [Populus tomentosa]